MALVKQHEVHSAQELMEKDNNFFLHFAPGSEGTIYRGRPVFQRLQEHEPDLVKMCLDSGDKLSRYQVSREDHYQTIFSAYQFMANNVHDSDPSVCNNQNPGGEFYLFR